MCGIVLMSAAVVAVSTYPLVLAVSPAPRSPLLFHALLEAAVCASLLGYLYTGRRPGGDVRKQYA